MKRAYLGAWMIGERCRRGEKINKSEQQEKEETEEQKKRRKEKNGNSIDVLIEHVKQ